MPRCEYYQSILLLGRTSYVFCVRASQFSVTLEVYSTEIWRLLPYPGFRLSTAAEEETGGGRQAAWAVELMRLTRIVGVFSVWPCHLDV